MRIDPLGLTLPVAAGQTLLEAAAAGGVPLPRSCRNGTCRACIARVTEGRVHHRIEWPGLSADELRAGWVLPCVALADSDLALCQPEVECR
jgi:ferredoxin